MPNNQFNGSTDQIENNVNKKDVFDPDMPEDAKSIGYPSLKLLVNLIHPIGSFYISSNPMEPSKIFGGTWEQIKDTFLLAAGNTYAAGSTGGESEHTLTVQEMPSHSHSTSARVPRGADAGTYTGTSDSTVWYELINSEATGSTGGSKPHNNMPPYLAVYMWQRIA